MITWILLGLAACLCSSYLYKHLKWIRRANALTAGVAGLPTLPLIGNAHQIFGLNPEQLLVITDKFADIANKEGGRFKFWIGPQFFLFTTLPEDIKTVNNTFLEKPRHYKFADLWVKNGLVSAPVEVWKKNVKRIHSIFTPVVVESFQDVFNAKARKIVGLLASEVGKGSFDAYRKYLGFVTFEAICETILGVSSQKDNVITKDYYEAFYHITKLLMLRFRNIFHHSDFIYHLSSSFREFKQCVKVLHGVTKSIISNKKKEIMEREKCGFPKNISNNNKDSTKINNDNSLLVSLIELKKTDPSLTDEIIQAITDNFVAAGQETTALTTILMLVMLGSHPKVQEKLLEEIQNIFGNTDRDVTKDDLERMTYTEAVILETARLFPIIPVMMRDADADLELEGCTIPEGTCVIVFAWGACRSTTHWGPDAKLFVPERWLNIPELPHPAVFCAFSYGKRSCVGRKFAMAFLKTVLAHTIRNLVIKSDASKLKFQLNIAIHPVEGHHIEVEHRHPVKC